MMHAESLAVGSSRRGRLSSHRIPVGGCDMQGEVSFAASSATRVAPGKELDLPTLTGERTFMRPQVAYLPNNRAILIAASEDNGVNNNPQPVASLVDVADPNAPKLLTIKN